MCFKQKHANNQSPHRCSHSKRIITFILTTAALAAAASVSAFAAPPAVNGQQETHNGYTYTYDSTEDGWHVRAVNDAETTYQLIESPFMEKPVLSMGEEAAWGGLTNLLGTFQDCADMETLPEAFTIPATVANMDNAFAGCDSLALPINITGHYIEGETMEFVNFSTPPSFPAAIGTPAVKWQSVSDPTVSPLTPVDYTPASSSLTLAETDVAKFVRVVVEYADSSNVFYSAWKNIQPAPPANGEQVTNGDYTYTFDTAAAGWHVRVTDNTKTSFGTITSPLDRFPVKSMANGAWGGENRLGTFEGCAAMESLTPEFRIPNTVTSDFVEKAFFGTTNLVFPVSVTGTYIEGQTLTILESDAATSILAALGNAAYTWQQKTSADVVSDFATGTSFLIPETVVGNRIRLKITTSSENTLYTAWSEPVISDAPVYTNGQQVVNGDYTYTYDTTAAGWHVRVADVTKMSYGAITSPFNEYPVKSMGSGVWGGAERLGTFENCANFAALPSTFVFPATVTNVKDMFKGANRFVAPVTFEGNFEQGKNIEAKRLNFPDNVVTALGTPTISWQLKDRSNRIASIPNATTSKIKLPNGSSGKSVRLVLTYTTSGNVLYSSWTAVTIPATTTRSSSSSSSSSDKRTLISRKDATASLSSGTTQKQKKAIKIEWQVAYTLDGKTASKSVTSASQIPSAATDVKIRVSASSLNYLTRWLPLPKFNDPRQTVLLDRLLSIKQIAA